MARTERGFIRPILFEVGCYLLFTRVANNFREPNYFADDVTCRLYFGGNHILCYSTFC